MNWREPAQQARERMAVTIGAFADRLARARRTAQRKPDPENPKAQRLAQFVQPAEHSTTIEVDCDGLTFLVERPGDRADDVHRAQAS